MTALVWDGTGERFYETGVDRGVLYVMNDGSYGSGVAWNGLTAVTESPSGAEATDIYADNIKYGTLRSAETFGCTIEAYTYPTEFGECDGSASVEKGVYIGQQTRKTFGFSYRTYVGSDTDAAEDNYKIHLVYGATASPSEKAYSTVNDSPEAITFSWEVSTIGVNVSGYKSTATMIIDSREVDPEKLKTFEAKIYGDESGEPTLMMPEEVIAHFKAEG